MEERVVIHLDFVEQDADVVDAIKTLGLFKETTALDLVEEVFLWCTLEQPLSIGRKLMWREEKDAVLFVQ